MAKRQPNPYFEFQQFTVFHDRCAMKVGTDGVLLGAWADTSNAESALDAGTGTGLIALMIAQKNHLLQIDAIDIDADAVQQAERNASQSPFGTRIEVQQVSLQDFSPKKRYDIIVSNPPFFNGSLKSPDEQRTMARHTDTLLVEDLIASASKLLSNEGKLSVIYPFEYKERLIMLASQYNMHITRVTNVLPTPQSFPKRILMEISTKENTLIENDLTIEVERHKYSDNFKELVNEFYLKI